MLLRILIGVAVLVVVMRAGIFVLRALGQGTPAPPPAGEMRRVNLRYRCTICGAEVRMTRAGEDLPEPPRHCLEDMQLETPIE